MIVKRKYVIIYSDQTQEKKDKIENMLFVNLFHKRSLTHAKGNNAKLVIYFFCHIANVTSLMP